MELGKSKNLQKRVTNLVNKLIVDENTVLFDLSNKISSKLEKKIKNCKYEKYIFFGLITNLKIVVKN